MDFEQITYNGAGTGKQVTDTVHLPVDLHRDLDVNSIAGPGRVHHRHHVGADVHGTGRRRLPGIDGRLHLQRLRAGADRVGRTGHRQRRRGPCTTTTYAANSDTSVWLVDLPAEVNVAAAAVQPTATRPCAGGLGHPVRLRRRQQLGATPAAGNLTKLLQAKAATAGLGLSYTYTTETSTYDQYGRVLTSTDADNRKHHHGLHPGHRRRADIGDGHRPAGLVTTTTYDPARDLPLTVTDPAGDQYHRDLRRARPGHRASGRRATRPPGPRSTTYTYTVSTTAPTVDHRAGRAARRRLPDRARRCTTRSARSARPSRRPRAAARTSPTPSTTPTAGRPWSPIRTTPAARPSGNSRRRRGRAACPRRPGTSTTAPAGSPAGRPTTLGTETWETDTTYGGNYTTVVPPAGGTAADDVHRRARA